MLRGEGLRAGIERFGEFANILFLKLISESEQIKRESGIPTKFDVACSWDSIKQIPISTRIEYINKTVYDKLNALYDTDIFTPLQIRDASILKEIMDKLDPLMLTDVDSDVKGDAFEYFLKASTSTKNDLGEYFTPRHIVKTMVRLVNPQIGEKIYDPFCGTGGFLIESFRYIHNNMARTEANMKTLRESTVYGNEITNTARITKMNMILAGDGHSNIKMLDSLANPIAVNYKYGQYQFAYFGLHLLYMTFIYCTAWKIGQIEPERYKDAIVFARPYSGRERDFNIEEAESIFAYSLMPEKEIAKLFTVIELDKSQISTVSNLVDTRNEMAHASGKFDILTEEIFEAKANSILNSMKNIHKCMDKPIRKWYGQVLLSFCKGEFDGYDDPKDVIIEQMIQTFKLSTNELLICNEMSINGLITEHRGYQTKLRDFKKSVSDHCLEMGYK